jgi:hypothetical protein
MPLFEILRDDNVVVFRDEETRKELEKHFLLVERANNEKHSFVVYTLDEDLNRVGREKRYIPYKDDMSPIVMHQKNGEDMLEKMLELAEKAQKLC